MRLYIKQVLYEMSCHNAFSVFSQIVKKRIFFKDMIIIEFQCVIDAFS